VLSSEDYVTKKKPARLAPLSPVPAKPSEETETHTRILRLALAVEESRAYWKHADPRMPNSEQAKQAFEQRWFGSKSEERVRYLLTSLSVRFNSFPNALRVLSQWQSMELATRQAICHWHLQLSDPIYRRFTGQFLVQRRSRPQANVDRDVVFRWISSEFRDKWSEATCYQFASKLLSAAHEAGLLSKRDPRTFLFPKITDGALGYLLYLLRETQFAGSLTANPYLISVGFDEDLLDARAHGLPGVVMRRMMHLVEFDWAHADLAAWVAEVAL
jgi:hypothetical protein